ncbi:MAG: hypothetical protein V4736_02130, partial [Bdellovibrionota bacterium]
MKSFLLSFILLTGAEVLAAAPRIPFVCSLTEGTGVAYESVKLKGFINPSTGSISSFLNITDKTGHSTV